jgi:hypothetical protein
VLVSPALLVDRDQQDVRLFWGQHHMANREHCVANSGG